MATDPDGDSQMASSPDSSHSVSDVEDTQPGSRTPTNKANTNPQQFAGSELSPPGSQTQQTAGMSDLGKGSAANQLQEGAEAAQQPGASWMNKRAEEEYQRAMEYVIDQDFSLDEFGDPFDDRNMEQKSF
ncbi:hypothetical protein BJX61DRAFT_173176 [Aspergillus egyptiacus]|nr:hypothetical protein BJX61DRAFT_173176 [Aspergillus egyptiacus]